MSIDADVPERPWSSMAQTPFGQAFEWIVTKAYTGVEPTDQAGRDRLAYVEDPARATEADAVAPVVEAYITTELDPAHASKGAGQAGPSLFKPLGTVLGKKLNAKGALEASKTAMRRSIAFPYAMVIEEEAAASFAYDPGSENEDIWRLAITGYRVSALKEMGIPKDWIGEAEKQATGVLLNQLRAADVLGFKVGRARYSGMFYGNFGALLRFGQTDYPVPMVNALHADVLGPMWEYPG